MKTIDKIIQSSTAPKRKDVVWFDTTTGELKMFGTSGWNTVSGGSGGMIHITVTQQDDQRAVVSFDKDPEFGVYDASLSLTITKEGRTISSDFSGTLSIILMTMGPTSAMGACFVAFAGAGVSFVFAKNPDTNEWMIQGTEGYTIPYVDDNGAPSNNTVYSTKKINEIITDTTKQLSPLFIRLGSNYPDPFEDTYSVTLYASSTLPRASAVQNKGGYSCVVAYNHGDWPNGYMDSAPGELTVVRSGEGEYYANLRIYKGDEEVLFRANVSDINLTMNEFIFDKIDHIQKEIIRCELKDTNSDIVNPFTNSSTVTLSFLNWKLPIPAILKVYDKPDMNIRIEYFDSDYYGVKATLSMIRIGTATYKTFITIPTIDGQDKVVYAATSGTDSYITQLQFSKIYPTT